jgi:hypothetical protein
VLKSGLDSQRRCGDHDFRVDGVRPDGGSLSVTYSWLDAEGQRRTWSQVLRLRDGMIIHMQDRQA